MNLKLLYVLNYIVLGGCFVEGEWLRNAFRWKESIGPWEERPGHFSDVWLYWTDDGLGYFEFLQVGIFYSFVGFYRVFPNMKYFNLHCLKA